MVEGVSGGGELSGQLTRSSAQVEGGNEIPVLVETTISNRGYVSGSFFVDTITPVLLQVDPIEPLSGRKYLTIRNKGDTLLYYGPNPDVAALLDSGEVIFKRQTVSIDVGADIPVYIISYSSVGNYTLQEFA